MSRSNGSRKFLAALPAVSVMGAGVLAGQILYAANRPDLPSFPNQDPSAIFGDPSLPRLRIVAVGDSSLTAPGVVDLDNTWIRQAAIGLSDRYCVDLLCLAVGGSRAIDVLDGQVHHAEALAPDIAVVSVGANDALRTPFVTTYEGALREIVTRLHRASGAVVLMGVGDLGTIPRLPALLSGFLTWRARTYDAAVGRTVAGFPRAARVEVWGSVSRAFRSGDPTLWSGDLFHASDTGHRVFSAEIGPVFERAVRHLAAGPPSSDG